MYPLFNKKAEQTAKLEELKHSLSNYANTSSDLYLIINVLNDLNLLEYYLNRQDDQSLTQISTVFSPKNLVPDASHNQTRDVYLLSICIWKAFSNTFFWMYFHLYFEDFLKKYLYLYLYFLIEKKSDFKYKYVLF